MIYSQLGRVDINSPKICGHSAAISDIKWNPFDDHVIASASDDLTVSLLQLLPSYLSVVYSKEISER